MGTYARDLFFAIFCDNNTITIYFMYFPHHNVEATQVLNGSLCILAEELLFNPNYFITRSGIQ